MDLWICESCQLPRNAGGKYVVSTIKANLAAAAFGVLAMKTNAKSLKPTKSSLSSLVDVEIPKRDDGKVSPRKERGQS